MNKNKEKFIDYLSRVGKMFPFLKYTYITGMLLENMYNRDIRTITVNEIKYELSPDDMQKMFDINMFTHKITYNGYTYYEVSDILRILLKPEEKLLHIGPIKSLNNNIIDCNIEICAFGVFCECKCHYIKIPNKFQKWLKNDTV